MDEYYDGGVLPTLTLRISRIKRHGWWFKQLEDFRDDRVLHLYKRPRVKFWRNVGIIRILISRDTTVI